MNKDLISIFEYLEREKGIKRELVITAIEEALRIAAYKSIENVGEPTIHVNPKTGDIEVATQKIIVEHVTDPDEEISLETALTLNEDCKIGQRLEITVLPENFGRIAAQTARQVISQKLREAERDVIYEEYRHRINELISGSIKRVLRGRTIIVDLGKVEAILPDRNYPKLEQYQLGERVQALLIDVRDTDNGGAEVILTRSHPNFVKALFAQEVPELDDNTIIVEKIVREPGYRTKIAVSSNDSKVDPVGTCVGVRGTRIKNVIRELNNEKIDIFPFANDPINLLKNALSPTEILRHRITDSKITLIINDDDYPIVIGKKGMNARLLSKLVDKEITVQKISEYQKLVVVQLAELSDSSNSILDQQIDEVIKDGISRLIIEELKNTGYDTIRKIAIAAPQDLAEAVPGMTYLDLAEKILEQK
jgi:N utilization substance protein A